MKPSQECLGSTHTERYELRTVARAHMHTHAFAASLRGRFLCVRDGPAYETRAQAMHR